MAGIRVLITGVAGFIGSNLAERLLGAGYKVVGIDNLAYGFKEQVPQGVEFHKVDIRSEEIFKIFKGIDFIFHLAAKNDLVACQENPLETIDINVKGTANVFEAARQAGVKKIIYASSSAVEEGEARLNGFYAISKLTNERMAKGFSELRLTTVGLRYFNVYGPRQDYRRAHPPVMSAFIIALLKGNAPVLYGDYKKNKRDFVYVDNINDFHLLCLKDERVNNRLFRLGSGKSYSMREVYEAVKKIMNSDVEPVLKPAPPGDTPTETLADIRDARALGWKPKTSIEDGLQKQADYLKDEFANGRIK